MKKIYVILALLLCFSNVDAQIITSHTEYIPANTQCNTINASVTVSQHDANQYLETSWGDMSVDTNLDSAGLCTMSHIYTYSGTYSIKHVLVKFGARIDSVSISFNHPNCETAEFKSYYDVNNNCINDPGIDGHFNIPIRLKVDSANVTIDTIFVLGGRYYKMYGAVGTKYKFTALPIAGITISCPANGILLDTIKNNANNHTIKNIGYTCSGATDVDLQVKAGSRTGRHHASVNILAFNKYCTPENAVLTVNFSSKYAYEEAHPAPTSVNGNTLTWNLNNFSLIAPMTISADFEVPGPWLTPGDTIHSSYYITPTAGDLDPSDNSLVIVDTVTSSYDPNSKDVMPRGDITAGTKLTYTIHFENTGNDTAHNIYVLDTLSDKLLPNTIQLLASTASMNYSMNKTAGGLYVAKFDFPNIKLLDSSHHGLCDGMFMFSIDTKPSLAPGTYIPNRAGIYFDDNEVVMTEYAMKMIEIPNKISNVSNNIETGLYPNPVMDVLSIYTDASAYNSLEISNAMGQLLIQQPLKQNEVKVNVKALPSGIYIMTLKGKDGRYSMKFEKL